MTVVWLLIIALAIVAVLALVATIVLAKLLTDDPAELERRRIEMEVRRAERRLHDLARDRFIAMLQEARRHGHGRAS